MYHGVVGICMFWDGISMKVCLLRENYINFIFMHCKEELGTLLGYIKSPTIERDDFGKKSSVLGFWRSHGWID